MVEETQLNNIPTLSDTVKTFENSPANVLDIIGTKINIQNNGKPSLNDFKALAQSLEIFSDKRYETARYFFIKKGECIRHVAISSQTPASTIIRPNKDFLYNLKEYAKDTDSQIVFCHNHPSGFVAPSKQDIEITEYIQNFFNTGNEDSNKNYFLGHVILNHGTYGIYTPETNQWIALINDTYYPIEKLVDNYQIEQNEYNIQIKFDSDLISLSEYVKNHIDYVDSWNTIEWIPVAFASINGIIKNIELINIDEFTDYEILKTKLQNIGRENNSESIYFIPLKNNYLQMQLCENFASETKMVKDIYFENDLNGFDLSEFGGGSLFPPEKLSIVDIKIEDSQNYSLQDLENAKKINQSTVQLHEPIINDNHDVNKIVNNFILDKLKSSGIEIITNKNDFENILASKELNQKQNKGLSNEQIKKYFSFNSSDVEKFYKNINDYKKIYLNPNIINSQTPIHEYTHLWNNYIQNTNKELWNKGLEAFKDTTIWNEVINDPHYADIINNENLILSECHARITDKVAEKVLKRIAQENGEIKKNEIIDWDKETWKYVTETYSQDISKFVNIKDFIEMPLNDLINEKQLSKKMVSNNFILKETPMEKEQNKNIISNNAKKESNNILKEKNINDKKINKKINNNSPKEMNKEEIITSYIKEKLENTNIVDNKSSTTSNETLQAYIDQWDNHILDTNEALWMQCKDALKNTSIWNEVINEPTNKDILNNENLILKKCHAKLINNIAQNAFQTEIESKGQLNEETFIDWNKETKKYLEHNYPNDIDKIDSIKKFIEMPMHDLATKNTDLLHEKTKNNESIISNNIQKPIEYNKNDISQMSNEELIEQLKKTKSIIFAKQKEVSKLQTENAKLTNQIKTDTQNSLINLTQPANEFSIDTAYTKNQDVPHFAIFDKKTKSFKDIKQSKFISQDAVYGQVTLDVEHDNGSHETLKLTRDEYFNIVGAADKYKRNLNKYNLSKTSPGAIYYNEIFRKQLGLDTEIMRSNTPANFSHNLKILCKNNPSKSFEEIMELADETLTKKMNDFNKKQMQKLNKKYQHKTAQLYKNIYNNTYNPDVSYEMNKQLQKENPDFKKLSFSEKKEATKVYNRYKEIYLNKGIIKDEFKQQKKEVRKRYKDYNRDYNR